MTQNKKKSSSKSSKNRWFKKGARITGYILLSLFLAIYCRHYFISMGKPTHYSAYGNPEDE